MSTNEVHDEGYDAFWDGVDVSENPYDEGMEGRRSWEEGWRAARKHDYDESEGYSSSMLGLLRRRRG